MDVLDLIKATLICGGIAFLVYTFPLFAQILIIGFVGVMWLFCAHQAVRTVWRKRVT